MGAKNWILVYSNGNPRATLAARPPLDRARSEVLVRRLFPETTLVSGEDSTLDRANPRDGDVLVGCYGDVSIVAAQEFGPDYPSKLDQHFLKEGAEGTIHLHAMHSVVDWTAFAIWRKGQLVRSLIVAPDGGALEDIGARLDFESPYWEGRHPVSGLGFSDEPMDYPLPFHPLELGEAALKNFFGYQLEGEMTSGMIDAAEFALLCFKRPEKVGARPEMPASLITNFLSSLFGRKPKA